MELQYLMKYLGEEWHLRKTNWCGEAADILDDEVYNALLLLMHFSFSNPLSNLLKCIHVLVVFFSFQSSTLEQERLKSGDLLLIEEGKLPPKVTAALLCIHYLICP